MRGIHRSPVISPHKGQWRGALMFSLIYAWINGWVNNREAGDFRRHSAHYDVTVMIRKCIIELVLDTYVCTYVLGVLVLCQRYDLIVGSGTEAHPSKIFRLYTAGKNTEYLKTQWKHSSLTSWLTWNGFAPTANMHYDLHATPICCAMDEKWNLQCLKLMINKGTKESIGMYHF